jgi:micrococcal nuclease
MNCLFNIFCKNKKSTEYFNNINKLITSSLETNEFNFKGQIKIAKVVSLYDGDTCKMTLFLEEELINVSNTIKPYRMTVRLNGLDAPEIKGSSDEEKKYAQVSKHLLSELILGKLVKIVCGDFDKYGRLLAEIYVLDIETNKEINVNEWMVKNGFCKRYDGGTKSEFIPFLENHPSKDEILAKIKIPKTKNIL